MGDANEPSVQLVAPGIHFVETPLVNWTVLSGDGTLTLIDAGYPGDADRVARVLDGIGGELDDDPRHARPRGPHRRDPRPASAAAVHPRAGLE